MRPHLYQLPMQPSPITQVTSTFTSDNRALQLLVPFPLQQPTLHAYQPASLACAQQSFACSSVPPAYAQQSMAKFQLPHCTMQLLPPYCRGLLLHQLEASFLPRCMQLVASTTHPYCSNIHPCWQPWTRPLPWPYKGHLINGRRVQIVFERGKEGGL